MCELALGGRVVAFLSHAFLFEAHCHCPTNAHCASESRGCDVMEPVPSPMMCVTLLYNPYPSLHASGAWR